MADSKEMPEVSVKPDDIKDAANVVCSLLESLIDSKRQIVKEESSESDEVVLLPVQQEMTDEEINKMLDMLTEQVAVGNNSGIIRRFINRVLDRIVPVKPPFPPPVPPVPDGVLPAPTPVPPAPDPVNPSPRPSQPPWYLRILWYVVGRSLWGRIVFAIIFIIIATFYFKNERLAKEAADKQAIEAKVGCENCGCSLEKSK